jgi:hypothetical protein
VRAVTSEPAATIAPDSTTALSSTIEPMPTNAPGSSVQAWITAMWPMVTSSPMSVPCPPGWPET